MPLDIAGYKVTLKLIAIALFHEAMSGHRKGGLLVKCNFVWAFVNTTINR